MTKLNWLAFGLLGLFLLAIAGCSSRNVINASDKTGMTPQERKDKRGN